MSTKTLTSTEYVDRSMAVVQAAVARLTETDKDDVAFYNALQATKDALLALDVAWHAHNRERTAQAMLCPVCEHPRGYHRVERDCIQPMGHRGGVCGCAFSNAYPE